MSRGPAETLEVSVSPDLSIQLLGEAASEIERLTLRLEFEERRSAALEKKLKAWEADDLSERHDKLLAAVEEIARLISVEPGKIPDALRDLRRILDLADKDKLMENLQTTLDAHGQCGDLAEQLREAAGREQHLLDSVVRVLGEQLPDLSPYDLKVLRDEIEEGL